MSYRPSVLSGLVGGTLEQELSLALPNCAVGLSGQFATMSHGLCICQ